MKIAIIDDDARCREEIRDCICRYLREHYGGETPQIEGFGDGEGFLSGFSPQAYDLVFIDQYMPGISGIGTARKIRETDRFVALVFVTSSRAHAIEGYGVRACGYLVKPYGYDEFARTMDLAGLEKIRNARSVSIGQEKVLLREVLWCDQDGHYIQVHTDRRGALRYRIPFGELTGLLAPYPQFLTCYKNCIINLERTDCMDGLGFLMDTGDRVPFSQRDKKRIESMYHAWLFQREREEILL